MNEKRGIDDLRPDTIATHAGRDPAHHAGAVNPPIYHASTILFDRVEAYRRRQELFYDGVGYGLYGTPTMLALAEAVAALEGAKRAVVLSSGTAAIAAVFIALTEAGTHVLVPDNVYGPVRAFCTSVLERFGVETTYYDPALGAGINAMIRPETRLVYMESPGSLTFEMQDIRAIASVARARGVATVHDGSWASPMFLRSLAIGVDVAIQSGTKYLGGHSDIIFGTVATDDEGIFRRIKEAAGRLGNRLGGEDCFLALRGIRTLPVRMARHQETGLRLARWLAAQPQVKRVLHPALASDPGHDLWLRDFTGASGLFGVLLHPVPDEKLVRMIESLRLFKMGSSWGGFESLIVPADPRPLRTATTWRDDGPLVRIHAGLEDVRDLEDDLTRGLALLAAG